MSKKTKKEKVLADYRRRLKILQLDNSSVNQTYEEPDKKEVLPLLIQTEETKEENKLKLYFTQDLKKSFFFISLIIALEIFVYFVTIKDYLKF